MPGDVRHKIVSMAAVLVAALAATARRGAATRGQCRRVDWRGMASNVLRAPSALPRFDEFKADMVQPGLSATLDEFEREFGELETRLEELGADVDYAGTVEALERIEAPLDFAWGMVSHLMGVKSSEELREAHAAMQPRVVEAAQAASQSKVVFEALRALDQSKLDPAQRRVVDKSIKGMEASGVGLADEQRAEFNKVQLRLAELSTKFANNVLDASKAFKLPLTQPEQVRGLPDTARAILAQNALNDGSEGATADAGPWLVTLDMPSYMAVMQHTEDRDLRERVSRAFISRASEGELDNEPLIREMIELRQKASAMLGYASHAHKSLANKMAAEPAKVLEMIEFMRSRAAEPARRELAELKAFAAERGGPAPDEMRNWDVGFWSERMREARYEFSEEDLRPFFALETVLEGLFEFAERLFGVKVVAADGSASVWHPDVRFFDVQDAGSGAKIASFYLDPYSRPEEKRGGAWMDVCVGKSRVLDRLPVAYLVCNGAPPTEGKPSLMSFDEVATLFHEFGHGLQHMLTTVEHAGAAGINLVEWDAVELPSQFMEEWLYDRGTLFKFARHYKTGEPLPEELFDKLCAARHFHSGMFMMRQLGFSAVDMALHLDDYDVAREGPIALQHRMISDFAVMPPLPEDRFLCSFQHIFAGGYSAGYYSYLWARVMSADAFAAFEERGLEDDAAVRELGRRFRDTVLASGGGTHPAEVFRAFRGRDPNPEPLLRHSGLAASSRL